MIDGISAVTLGTHEMPRAVRFYRSLGFEVLHGGDESSFTSFRAGTSYLNLIAQPAGRRWFWWGRVIFYVAHVDALYDRALAAGYQPATLCLNTCRPHDNVQYYCEGQESGGAVADSLSLNLKRVRARAERRSFSSCPYGNCGVRSSRPCLFARPCPRTAFDGVSHLIFPPVKRTA